MNTNHKRVYHVVQFKSQNNLTDCTRCIPASWIRMYDEIFMTVLMVYPDEPQEITRERVKVYEDPGEYWNLHWAQIKYTTDFYDSVIKDINERELSIAGPSSSGVNCTENENPNSFPSLQAWLSSAVNHSSVFWPMLQIWANRQPNSDDSRFSTANNINKVISNSDSEESDKEDLYVVENDVPWDLSKPPKTVQELTPKSLQNSQQVNNTNNLLSVSIAKKYLTLKHCEYSPGLEELIPGSCVYIAKEELDDCLRCSRDCSELARLLTRGIFTTANVDYEKQVYYRKSKKIAVAAIMKFALNYGIMKNWRPSCEKSLKKTIYYQETVLKHSN